MTEPMPDDLEQALKKCKRARLAMRKAVALWGESDLDSIRDSLREDLLETLDDVAMQVEVARLAVSGGLSDQDVWGLCGD